MTKQTNFGNREGHIRSSPSNLDRLEGLSEFYGVSTRRLKEKFKVGSVDFWSEQEKVMRIGLGPGSAGDYRAPRYTGTVISQLTGSTAVTPHLRRRYPYIETRNVGRTRSEGRISFIGSYGHDFQ